MRTPSAPATTTVVAMFMNNRAAESIAQGKLDDAYWWARAAIVHDPNFIAAYNTLGVAYHRKGRLAEAHRRIEEALHPAVDIRARDLRLLRLEGRAPAGLRRGGARAAPHRVDRPGSRSG